MSVLGPLGPYCNAVRHWQRLQYWSTVPARLHCSQNPSRTHRSRISDQRTFPNSESSHLSSDIVRYRIVRACPPPTETEPALPLPEGPPFCRQVCGVVGSIGCWKARTHLMFGSSLQTQMLFDIVEPRYANLLHLYGSICFCLVLTEIHVEA